MANESTRTRQLTNAVIDLLRAEGNTVANAATVLTALQYVVAQVLAEWRIPPEIFLERVKSAIREHQREAPAN